MVNLDPVSSSGFTRYSASLKLSAHMWNKDLPLYSQSQRLASKAPQQQVRCPAHPQCKVSPFHSGHRYGEVHIPALMSK